MRQVINRLLGRKPRPSSPPQEPVATSRGERADGHDNPHTIEDSSDNAVRCQLVQMMLRDALRKHGIPPAWIECRFLGVHSRSRGPGLHVKLVMRHWDMLLLTYAHAFEQQLMAAIEQFEPKARQWLYGFSWELDVSDSCPYPDMPDPSIWQDPPLTAGATMPLPLVKKATPRPVAGGLPAAAPEPEPLAPATNAAAESDEELLRRDLERMFAIRDANIEQAFNEVAQLDFQNTQPAERS